MTNESLITLTDAAAAHIHHLLKASPASVGLRLSVKKMGCTGYSIVPNLVSEAVAGDIAVNTTHQFPVFLDGQQIEKLQGLVVDFIKKDIANTQLVFTHPRAKNVCGCGESFSFEEFKDE